MRALIEADWIDRDRRFALGGPAVDASAQRNARGVTTVQDAAGGCDGVKNGHWGFHTASGEQEPWWQVDLGEERRLDRVVVFNRTDGTTAPRTKHLRMLVASGASAEEFHEVYRHNGETFYGVNKKRPLVVDLGDKDVSARIVRLHVPGRCSFALDEVEVYAADDPRTNVALGKPADQKSVGPHSYPGTMGELSPASIAGQGGGFSLAHTRDVVSRGQGLIARLRPSASSDRLGPLAVNLRSLDQRLAQLEGAGDVPEDARRAIYLEARWLVRRIAFCNPLLDFDRLLFIKRHDPGGVFHMCDQYYGFNARPGGGLFVLADPFTPNPRLTDLLEDSIVEKGRLAGGRLLPGSFLSPELSWDGETILFAYTQCQGGNLTWTPEASYHVFRVNA
ncbi:MAG: discoidin domain-containing protein, partial [Armatimonadota bacterium]